MPWKNVSGFIGDLTKNTFNDLDTEKPAERCKNCSVEPVSLWFGSDSRFLKYAFCADSTLFKTLFFFYFFKGENGFTSINLNDIASKVDSISTKRPALSFLSFRPQNLIKNPMKPVETFHEPQLLAQKKRV